MKPGLILLLILLLTALAGSALADVRDIELRRLFEPTPAERKAERAGRIFIYEGLRDRDVERAMDEEFDRVDSMMFIRLQVTDEQGEPLKDPESGAVVYQEDGC